MPVAKFVQDKVNSFKLFTGEDTVPDYVPRILLCGINTLEIIDNPKYVVNGHTDTVRTEKLQSLYIPLVHGISYLEGRNDVYSDGNVRTLDAWLPTSTRKPHGLLKNNCEIIILDYFWLQRTYLEHEGYGNKWYSHWIPLSFGLSGLIPKFTTSVFFLPNDRWNLVAEMIYPGKELEKNCNSTGLDEDRVKLWQRPHMHDIGIILLDVDHAKKYCPLWHATSMVDESDTYKEAPNGDRKTNASALWDGNVDGAGYIRGNYPIIMFYNKRLPNMSNDNEAKQFILSRRVKKPR